MILAILNKIFINPKNNCIMKIKKAFSFIIECTLLENGEKQILVRSANNGFPISVYSNATDLADFVDDSFVSDSDK